MGAHKRSTHPLNRVLPTNFSMAIVAPQFSRSHNSTPACAMSMMMVSYNPIETIDMILGLFGLATFACTNPRLTDTRRDSSCRTSYI